MTGFCHQTALIFVVRSKGILQFPALTFTQWMSSWTSILLNFTVCPDETRNHTLIYVGQWNPIEVYFVCSFLRWRILMTYKSRNLPKHYYFERFCVFVHVYLKKKQTNNSKPKQCYGWPTLLHICLVFQVAKCCL